ncbi:hypothetical protein MASR2M79_02520 [Aminivibrio sp.]
MAALMAVMARTKAKTSLGERRPIMGRVTLRKVVSRSAPRFWAASMEGSIWRRTAMPD